MTIYEVSVYGFDGYEILPKYFIDYNSALNEATSLWKTLDKLDKEYSPAPENLIVMIETED